MNKKENKIILTAEAELEDKGARELVSILETRVQTLNDRTKQHTKDIMELRRFLKANEGEKK